ncbi:hypothetical protein V8C44DRAFT_351671 [Trichoderma aethiopicum]
MGPVLYKKHIYTLREPKADLPLRLRKPMSLLSIAERVIGGGLLIAAAAQDRLGLDIIVSSPNLGQAAKHHNIHLDCRMLSRRGDSALACTESESEQQGSNGAKRLAMPNELVAPFPQHSSRNIQARASSAVRTNFRLCRATDRLFVLRLHIQLLRQQLHVKSLVLVSPGRSSSRYVLHTEDHLGAVRGLQ